MGWQDREYNRIGNSRFQNPLLNILFGSLPLGTWFGVRVRIHATLIMLIAWELIFAGTKDGYGFQITLMKVVVLFGIIVLHEFGHCFGARIVGGDADEVLLWPLGGLAYARAPHRPWPTFVTVAAGPAVNVLICIATGAAMWVLGHFDWSMLDPLAVFGGKSMSRLSEGTWDWILSRQANLWLYWIFASSLSLLFFNLLPIYPMDGGQMLQAILWKPLGYRRSMNFACVTGMVGAVLGFVYSFFPPPNLMLALLAASGFYTCFQMRRMLKMNAYEESAEQYDLSAAWEDPGATKPRRKVKRRWFNAARKRALADQAQQEKIDAILAKVKEKGLHSLTWWEKRTLRKATERQRQQGLAERL
jgi:Zn-dependent protease